MQAVCPSDPALHPFLQAKEENEALHQLEALLSQVEPTIRSVIRRRWSSSSSASEQDRQRAEDIFADVVYQLVSRLREIRSSSIDFIGEEHAASPGTPIGNFRAFAAVTTARVCDAYVREKYPNRNRLRRRLEYLLGERSPVRGFALWTTSDGHRLTGFARWREEGKRRGSASRHRSLVENPASLARSVITADPAHADPGELIAALFNWLEGPIDLDELVGVMARLWNVVDEPTDQLADEDENQVLRSQTPGVDTAVVRHEYLRSLWAEIRQLPSRQAAALLLNLRDSRGNGLIALLPITRTASITEIAGAIGMEPLELARIWTGLPMDDLHIAELFKCTRQQVINLRRSARERLARRMENLSL